MEVIKPTVAAFTYLIRDNNAVYLQRRSGTGYMDGFYEPPCGKVEDRESPEEAAHREAHEEAGVSVSTTNLELFHVYLNYADGDPWLGLMFRTRSWEGQPTISEPEKCDDAGFFKLDELPKTTPQVHDGLSRILLASSIEIATYRNITS